MTTLRNHEGSNYIEDILPSWVNLSPHPPLIGKCRFFLSLLDVATTGVASVSAVALFMTPTAASVSSPTNHHHFHWNWAAASTSSCCTRCRLGQFVTTCLAGGWLEGAQNAGRCSTTRRDYVFYCI